MRGAQLEDELVLLAQVQHLAVAAPAQVPDVQIVTIAAVEQDVGHKAVLERLRRAPLAGDQSIVAQMPPEVVGEVLRASVELPLTEHVEGFRVHAEDPAGPFALRGAEGVDEDAVRPAVHRVRAAVVSPRGQLLGFDSLDDLRFADVGLGVDDVEPRGAQTGYHQVAPLGVRVGSVGTQAGAAGVPAEVVQLVTNVGHVELSYNLAVGGGGRVNIHHRQRVRPAFELGIQQGDKGVFLRRRLHSEFRRWIKSRVGSQQRHFSPQVFLRAGPSYVPRKSLSTFFRISIPNDPRRVIASQRHAPAPSKVRPVMEIAGLPAG